LIWKSFMTRALGKDEPASFPPRPYLPAVEKRVVWRDGGWKLDNGVCPGTRVVAYFADRGPTTAARCYSNEVAVPLVIGKSVESATTALGTVPLGASVVLIPAKAGARPGEVVNQEPRGGFASAGSVVQLYVSHAKDGLVPNLVGSSVTVATAKLRKLRLKPRVTYDLGPSGTVLEQSLEPGVAVAPGLRVELVVGRDPTG
jgi:hypothetical protein